MINRNIITVAIMALFSGCAYTDSALSYAKVQNERVQAGYTTKQVMTTEIMRYVADMNKDCGVKVEMVNGVPVTNVKHCITIHEAMASVSDVQIQRAEGVESIGDGTAKVLTSAATLAVPLGTAYMQYDASKTSTRAQVEITKSNNAANVSMNESNNALQSNMMNSYTGNFQNTTTTTTTSDVSDTTVDSSNNTEITTDISDTTVDSSNNTDNDTRITETTN